MARTTFVRVLVSIVMVTGAASIVTAGSLPWFGSSANPYQRYQRNPIPVEPQRNQIRTEASQPAVVDTSAAPPLALALSTYNGTQIQPTSVSPLIKHQTKDGTPFFETNVVFDIAAAKPSFEPYVPDSVGVISFGGEYGDTFTIYGPKTAAANLGTGCSGTLCLNGDPHIGGVYDNRVFWPYYTQIKPNDGSVDDTITLYVADTQYPIKRVAHVTINRHHKISSLDDMLNVKVEALFLNEAGTKSIYQVFLLDANGNKLCYEEFQPTVNITSSTHPNFRKPSSPFQFMHCDVGKISDIATVRFFSLLNDKKTINQGTLLNEYSPTFPNVGTIVS